MIFHSQKYLEHAREYRKNYTQIQELEFRLKHINENEIEVINEIETKYCALLDSSSNHSTYDYYWTIYTSNNDYKMKKWKSIEWRFKVNVIWRFIAKFLLIILPLIIYFICEVI